MAEQKGTKGVVLDKYKYYVPEDPEARKKEEGKTWNNKKLIKVITNDYILSYQELLEMRLVFVNQLATAKKEKENLEREILDKDEHIVSLTESVEKWENEIELAEKDIPEIGKIARDERKFDEEKREKHEAKLRGEGEGRAFEMNPETGEVEDKTGSKKFRKKGKRKKKK